MRKVSEYYLTTWLKKYIFMFLAIFLLLPQMTALAAQQDSGPYFTIDTVQLSNGTNLEQIIIHGPPIPPPGSEFDRQVVSLPEPDRAAGINILTVPAFNWVFGCSAVSAAMIAGYYDRSGWPNIYTGPTNNGVMPLNNSSWPTWSDGYRTYPSCPLIASKNGVDGRTTPGSIDDYWVQYNSSAVDPYITNGSTLHTWGEAIGDYMKTSQSDYDNPDGSTSFWSYGDATKLTCDAMSVYGITNDGTQGRKLFYEARGYTVTDCYNQKTDNKVPGGFSFNQFKAEIDAGRPVMLNLYGHTVVGVGYDDATQSVYLHDTWDYNNHTMTWGQSYSGMELQSVSIVNLSTDGITLNPPSNLTATAASSSQINLTWADNSANETGFLVERKRGNSGTWSQIASLNANVGTYSDIGLEASTTYYYRVQAYNGSGNSAYSNEANATTSGVCTSSTTAISVGSMANGTLATTDCQSTAHPGSYYDNFTFAATANTPYIITLNSAAFDAYLYLLNSAGTVLAMDDDSNGGKNSKITYTPKTSETLTIQATSYQSGETGSYTISLSGGTAPAAPTGVAASDGTYTDRVAVKWNVSTGAISYEVWRNTSSSTTSATRIASGLTGTAYDDTSAVARTTYYYRLKACNSAGCSGFSSYNTGYRAALTAPAAPTGVTASDGTYTDRVAVKWNASTRATRYEVWRNTSSSTTSATRIASDLTGTAYDDTSAVARTTYYYRLKACNSAGCSGFSSYNTGYRTQ